MKIIIKPNCGNSPKAKFIVDYIANKENKTLDFLFESHDLEILTAINHGKYGVVICKTNTQYAIYFEFNSAASYVIKEIKVYKEDH